MLIWALACIASGISLVMALRAIFINKDALRTFVWVCALIFFFVLSVGALLGAISS